jgi:hypothetical protein
MMVTVVVFIVSGMTLVFRSDFIIQVNETTMLTIDSWIVRIFISAKFFSLPNRTSGRRHGSEPICLTPATRSRSRSRRHPIRL